MKISVAIPTYKRPNYLFTALRSVCTQTMRPWEIIVVCRSGDSPSEEVVDRLRVEYPQVNIRIEFVVSSGFLPPIIKAIETASGEVLALLDDDAEAPCGWLLQISRGYVSDGVAGVGGRCVNYFDGIKQHYPPVRRVGRLLWLGKPIGNMYCDCKFNSSVGVDFLMGGNCSYRLEVIRKTIPDMRLSENVSFHWEIDVGLRIKRLGYQLIFDPGIAVKHYSAPREIEGLRTINFDGMFWSNYNFVIIMKKHMPPLRFTCFLVYSFLVGWSGSPGIVWLLFRLFRGHKIEWKDLVYSSFLGRLKGVLTFKKLIRK